VTGEKPENINGYNEIDIDGLKVLLHEDVKYHESGIRIKLDRYGKFDVTGIDYYRGY
jgi:hypothetical protein